MKIGWAILSIKLFIIIAKTYNFRISNPSQNLVQAWILYNHLLFLLFSCSSSILFTRSTLIFLFNFSLIDDFVSSMTPSVFFSSSWLKINELVRKLSIEPLIFSLFLSLKPLPVLLGEGLQVFFGSFEFFASLLNESWELTEQLSSWGFFISWGLLSFIRDKNSSPFKFSPCYRDFLKSYKTPLILEMSSSCLWFFITELCKSAPIKSVFWSFFSLLCSSDKFLWFRLFTTFSCPLSSNIGTADAFIRSISYSSESYISFLFVC